MTRRQPITIGRHRRHSAGFTLVELIVAAGLIGLLAATATWYWVDVSRLSGAVTGDNAAVTEARSALERLSKEIREVKYDTGTSRYCVDTGNMTATKLVFNKHSPNLVPPAGPCGGTSPNSSSKDFAVTVDFVVPPGSATGTLGLCYTCTPTSSAARQILLGSVSSFSMTYLPASGDTATADTGLLRFVQIELTVKPTDAPPTSMKTRVALRNQ